MTIGLDAAKAKGRREQRTRGLSKQRNGAKAARAGATGGARERSTTS